MTTTEDWATCSMLGDIVVKGAHLWPDRDAIVFPHTRKTFAELLDGTMRKARGLLALGVGRGDHVAMIMPNSIDFVETFFAISMVGAVPVPINLRYLGEELAYVVDHSDVSTLVIAPVPQGAPDLLGRLADAFPDLPVEPNPAGPLTLEAAAGLARVLVLGGGSHGGCVDEATFYVGAETVPPERVEKIRATVRIRDVAMLIYTSGTTAKPKGCLLSHEAIVRDSREIARRIGVDETSRFWNPLPMFHVGGVGLLAVTLNAGAVYLGMEYFEPKIALDLIGSEKATHLFANIAALMQPLVDHPDFATTSTDQVQWVAMILGAENDRRRFQEMLPHAVQATGFGCTEADGITTYNELTDPLEARIKTQGVPLRGAEMRIAYPETNETLPDGQSGEICLRGYCLFEGYYKDPEKTASVVDTDGWFHTGDQGSIDPDGRLLYEGRYKDMLKVGGENVAALEIETLLERHDAVRQAQVVGMPDDRLQEVPAAFVELEPGVEPVTEEDLIAYCTGKIASFKVPRAVRFVEEWPLSTSGVKVEKGKLRDRLVAELGLG